MNSRRKFEWTPERVETLKRLYLRHTATRIAQMMQVDGEPLSRGAVLGKASRLGLTGKSEGRSADSRPSMPRPLAARVWRERAPSAPPVKAEKLRIVNARAIAGQQRLVAIADGVIAPIQPLPPTTLIDTGVEAKPWLERQWAECAAPVSGEGASTYSCCAPTDGGPYCPGHRRLFFNRSHLAGAQYTRSLRRYG